jgi:Ca2+-binding RTX toxin-like protein
VLSLAAFQALAIVGAGVAQAVSACSYDPLTDTVHITLPVSGDSAFITVETAADDLDTESAPGAILFAPSGVFPPDYEQAALSTSCGSATVDNTVSIVVLGSPNGDEFFGIDEISGGEFNTATTWAVDMGGNTVGGTDEFEIDASDGIDNEIVLTDSSFTLNGGGGELLGVENIQVFTDDGDDIVDASAVSSAVEVNVSTLSGDDWVALGAFDGDSAAGGTGVDTLSYGTRTTCTVIDNVAGLAGQDANCDGDLADVGDEVDTHSGFETLETGSGNDTLIGSGAVTETFVPGDGDDDITGQAADTIDWSSSSAAMLIDPANGTATGQGTDTFDGPTGFVGSDFNDTLIWDGTTTFFSGGAGTDLVDASATTAGVAIDLDTLDGVPVGGVGAPADDLENVKGGTGNDLLIGNDLRNRIEGGDGDDVLTGAGGNDFLIGSAGNDTYSGGLGADKVSFKNSPAGVEADMLAGFAIGEGDDSLLGDIEILVGSQFNDNFTGGGGVVATNFRFIGNGGKDLLTGSGSNDTLKGGAGNDIIRGVGGDDTLVGAAGNDRLFGGAGVDVGRGGVGKDICKSVEIKSSCGKKGHPKSRSFAAAAAAKLARL